MSLGLTAATGCIPDPEPVASECATTPTTGLEARTLGERNYLLLVPPGVPSSGEGVPIIVSLHGLNSNAAQMAGYTPWPALAASEPVIVAYPNAVDGAWNHGQGSADVTFVRALIAELETAFCTDRSRVYVTGHSLGAYMAQRMACDAADVVASVTEYAGGPPTIFFGNTPCTPSRPISVGVFHGEADRVVIPALGSTTRDNWVERLHCTSPPLDLGPAVPAGQVVGHLGCDGGAIVGYRTYTGQGHLWPATGPIAEDIATDMWAFLRSQWHPTR